MLTLAKFKVNSSLLSISGNEFSSLEGIEFDWTIIGLGPKKDVVILNFMKFQESPYETPETIKVLEEQNKKGHVVLLRGIKTGAAKVSIRLSYEEYKDVNAFEFNIIVMANLIISPADAYMMAGDVVPFKILHVSFKCV